jgi:predicted phage-related endonuclease
MSALPDVVQTREQEFQQERRSGIGGSDMAALFSLEYGCARRLAYEKLGTTPDYEDSEATLRNFERGKHGEAIAAAQYVKATGRRVRRMPVRRHPQHPEFLVHTDRQIITIDDRGPGALEIKCPSAFAFRKLRREGMADAYTMQGQWELFVTGYRWGSFAVFQLDSWQLLWFDFERDEALIEQLAEAAAQFWVALKEGLLPERLAPEDSRCQRCLYKQKCQGAALLTQIKDKVVPIRQEDRFLDALADEYLEAHELEREAKELKESAKGRLQAALGEQKAVDTGRHRIYWTSYPRKEYTVKASVVTSLRVYGV